MEQLFVAIVHVWLGEFLKVTLMQFCLHINLRLGESCSHIAAIFFKVECAVRLGYTSVTAQRCLWNESFVSKVSQILTCI